MRGSSCADAGVSLASTILFALDQRAEVKLVALDIKGAFNWVWWKGLLCHLWNVGLHRRAFELYFSNCYLYVVTAGGISSSVPISAGVPQDGIWLPLLFNLYTHLIPPVVNHSQLFSYADNHILLKIIPPKAFQVQAIHELNSDLAALVQYGVDWLIEFAPLKTIFFEGG